MSKSVRAVLACFLFGRLATTVGASPPRHVYLTLGEGQHPEHFWLHAHYRGPQKSPPIVAWRLRTAQQWNLEPARWRKVEFADERRYLVEHSLKLQPGSLAYQVELRMAGEKPRELSVRSLPQQGAKLRFTDGGDTGIGPAVAGLFRRAALQNPDFCLMGGDYAYEGGDPRQWSRFDRWLDLWTTAMRRPDGSLVPMLPVLGNHEVQGHFDATAAGAPFWVEYFNRGRPISYNFRQLPNRLGLWTLDSGHIQAVDGSQKDWLQSSLAAHADLDFKLAAYHVPLYPSHRRFEDRRSLVLRQHWLPLFDQFGLNLALEHHDHAHKRTRPLKGGQPHDGGTIYLGDGCWGQQPRSVDRSRPYLTRADGRRHFWLLVSSPGSLEASAIDERGQVFDHVLLRNAPQAGGGPISNQQQPSRAQSGSR